MFNWSQYHDSWDIEQYTIKERGLVDIIKLCIYFILLTLSYRLEIMKDEDEFERIRKQKVNIEEIHFSLFSLPSIIHNTLWIAKVTNI